MELHCFISVQLTRLKHTQPKRARKSLVFRYGCSRSIQITLDVLIRCVSEPLGVLANLYRQVRKSGDDGYRAQDFPNRANRLPV